MSELRDQLMLDIAQPLAELKRLDAEMDRVYGKQRKMPSVPASTPTTSPTGPGTQKTAAEAQLDRIGNRLKVVQAEMRRLGDDATQQQLEAYQLRLQRLTTQATLLAPGLDQGGRAAARLQGILTGLQGTSDKVSGSLDRLVQGPPQITSAEGLILAREQIKLLGNEVGTLRNKFIAGTGPATQEEVNDLVRGMTALKTQANQLAATLPRGSNELRQLSVYAAQAERTIAGATGQMSRLGLASQVKLGVGSALSEMQAFQGPINGLAQMARFSDQARVASLLYESQLKRQNLSMEQGATTVDKLANRLKVLPSQVQDAVQVLLRNGYDLNQAYTVLERAGASAVAKGMNASQGIETFSSAIQSQQSALLNSVGISGNLDDFYVSYARNLDISSKKLTEQQKAQAVVNGVMRETTEELANLDTIQASLGGGFSDLATAGQKFSIAFGKTFSGPVGDAVKLLTGATNVMNAMPRPLQDVLAKLTVFGVGIALTAKIAAVLKGQIVGVNAALFGTAASGTAGAGGLAAYNAQLAFLRTKSTAALTAMQALGAAASIIGAATIGVTIGLQINEIDLGEGKGKVKDQIQLEMLKWASESSLDGIIMRKLLSIDQATATAGAKQLSDDLTGITKKAEEEFRKNLAKGGTQYAGLIRIRTQAIESNRDATQRRRSTTDPQELASLDALIGRNNTLISSTNRKILAIEKAQAAKSKDVAATVKQMEAYGNLDASLKALGDQFGSAKATSFERELEQARKSFLKFTADIDKAVKDGEITEKQGKVLRSGLNRMQTQVIPDLVTRQVEQNKKAALEGQRELEEGRIALIRDARVRAERELTLETDKIRDTYKTRIDEARQNSEARGLPPAQRKQLADEAVRLEGERDARIELARQQSGRRLEDIEREAHQRLLTAQANAAQAEIAVVQAGLTELTQARDAALTRSTGNAERLQVERQFGVQLVALQRQIAQNERTVKEAEALQTYTEDMRLAREGGENRAALELAARKKYGAILRTLEITTRTEISSAVIAQKEREDKALATLEQRGLDRTLQNINKVTGAELVSLQRRLTARRAAAAATGNAPLTEALDRALETVSKQAVDNAQGFREELGNAAREAATLQTQLKEVAQTPLEKAVKSATSPFDGVSEKAKKQLDDLRKAYGKVASPTPQQTADFQRQQATLTGLVTQAAASRAQAKRDAEVKYQQEVNDKQQSAFLAQAKRELDLGQITQDEYERRLRLDLAYWTARRDNARRAGNTEGADQADGKVQAVQSELVRLEGERRQLARDTAAFSREQLQNTLEQARTEGERVIALDALNASDRERVSALNSEISKLEAQGGHEKDILALKRERAAVQRELTSRAQEELNHSKALRQSVLDRVDAENKLAEKKARTDDDLAVVRARSLLNLYSRVSEIDIQFGNARSDEERNRLTSERLNLTGQILDLENTIADAPLEIARRHLDVLRETVQARLQLAGLADDEVASAQGAVEVAARELEIAQQAVAAARTQAEQERAGAALATAQANLSKANAQLAQAPVVAAERQLGVFREMVQARLQLAGLAEDEVAVAGLNADNAQRDLRLAQDRLAVAQTQVQIDQATAALQTAWANVVKARAAEALAPILQQERLLGLLKAQVEERRVLAGLDGDPVAEAQARLQFAEADLQLARERAEVASSQVEREKAASDISSRNTEVERARKAVITAQLAERDKLLARIKEEATAQATLTGLNRDAVASKQLELEFTQLDRRETEQRLANAQALMLTSQDITDLQLKRSSLMAQEVKQQQELARALFDQARAAADLAEATTRSQLARSQFFDDGVALAKVDLAATRQKLVLTAQEIAQADELGLSATERLNLQKERLNLLGQEAEGMRKVAQAQRERLVFTRALRDSLEALRAVARDQSERTAVQRATDDAALALQKLRQAEGDAAGFLARLRESQDAWDRLRERGAVDEQLFTGLREAGLSAGAAADQVNRLSGAAAQFALRQSLTFHEAQEGKERVEALTGAISDYRSKLAAVADAYDQQISGIESVVQATSRLNELSQGTPATAFSAQVNELQRQQALAETNRLLSDQHATYAQISAAAGRLAEAEGQRLTIERNLLGNLATRGQKGDADAVEELRQRLSSLGYAGDEVTAMLRRVQKEGASALSDVQLRISQEAESRLAQLRDRALQGLSDVARLRAESFKARVESAKAFEEYARLNSALTLAEAGFTDIEAEQIAAIDRQERLKGLIGKTSVLQADFISRKQALAALNAENAALIAQVRARKGLGDARLVTRDDLAEQRDLNRAITTELERQNQLAQLATLPYHEAAVATQATAAALKTENDLLAAQVATRLEIDPAAVTRAQLAEQRQLNEEVARYNQLEETRYNNIAASDGYNRDSKEVKSALLLALAAEDAFYADEKRRERAIGFEIEKAKAVAEALAPLQTRLETARAVATATAVQEELGKLKVPSLDAQMRNVGVSAGEQLRLAIEQQLSRPLGVQLRASGLASGGPGGQSIQKSQTVNKTFHNSFNITTQPGQDVNVPALAREVATHLNQQAEVYGECH